MVYIPGGEFVMGSPSGEGHSNEKPQHQVRFSPFYMGKFPVTQEQWKAIAKLSQVKCELKLEPSRFTGKNQLPIEQISWDDAVEFCNQLSKVTGTEYRLPSEAEWEYACRAGTATPFHFGEKITDKLANYGTNMMKTNSVGKFPPNAFGLLGMVSR